MVPENQARSEWIGTYLDANASENPRPEAVAAYLASLGSHANPASVHGAGRAARRLLDQCRDVVAAACDAPVDGVVFTSGGTESDALAVAGLGRGRRIVVGATEHDAVLAAAGPGAVVLPVSPDGVADLDALRSCLSDGEPTLVCLMLANNETGVLHPIETAAMICRSHGALLHVDAVQAAGRMPVSLASLGASSLALSAHKQGGLAGAGALLLAEGVELGASLFVGGGQELGRRGGTQALPAIAAFAACAGSPPPSGMHELRDLIEQAATQAGAVACGAGAARLANTTCLALPGRPASWQLIALDLAGFAVSAGAACSSGKIGRSRVLDAMGLGALAGEAIRVSLPWNATRADAEAFAAAYVAMARRRVG